MLFSLIMVVLMEMMTLSACGHSGAGLLGRIHGVAPSVVYLACFLATSKRCHRLCTRHLALEVSWLASQHTGHRSIPIGRHLMAIELQH